MNWVKANWLEGLVVLVALVYAHLHYAERARRPLYYDDAGYTYIALDICQRGLCPDTPHAASQLRTYLYPLLLSGIEPLAKATGLTPRLLAFETQALLYLLAVAWVRLSIVSRLRSPRTRTAVGCALWLNPLPWVYAGELLTESISLSLLLVLAALLMQLARARAWSVSFFVAVLGIALLSSASVLIRPASSFVWAAAVLSSAVVLVGSGSSRLVKLAVLGLCVSGASWLVAYPQWVNNLRWHGRDTPLVACNLQAYMLEVGKHHLRYATAVPPMPRPQVLYDNPLFDNKYRIYTLGESTTPGEVLAWYAQHPGVGALTLGLHYFGLLDQDLPFAYNHRVIRKHAQILHWLSHVALALAAVGAYAAWRSRRLAASGWWPLGLLVTLLLLGHAAVYAPVIVECRYGLPLTLLIWPLAGYGLVWLGQARCWTLLLSGVALGLYLSLAMQLSGWVQDHSPVLTQAKHFQLHPTDPLMP